MVLFCEIFFYFLYFFFVLVFFWYFDFLKLFCKTKHMMMVFGIVNKSKFQFQFQIQFQLLTKFNFSRMQINAISFGFILHSYDILLCFFFLQQNIGQENQPTSRSTDCLNRYICIISFTLKHSFIHSFNHTKQQQNKPIQMICRLRR